MKCYMGCNVYFEHRGRGRRGSWVIRDGAWDNRLVRDLGPNFIHSDIDEDAIIRAWCEAKKTNPEWLEYCRKIEIKRHNKEIEKTLEVLN